MSDWSDHEGSRRHSTEEEKDYEPAKKHHQHKKEKKHRKERHRHSSDNARDEQTDTDHSDGQIEPNWGKQDAFFEALQVVYRVLAADGRAVSAPSPKSDEFKQAVREIEHLNAPGFRGDFEGVRVASDEELEELLKARNARYAFSRTVAVNPIVVAYEPRREHHGCLLLRSITLNITLSERLITEKRHRAFNKVVPSVWKLVETRPGLFKVERLREVRLAEFDFADSHVFHPELLE